MKSVRILPILLAFCALALVIAPAALGQQETAAEGAARFNGNWRYAGSASHGREIIERAVVRAVDGMNFITQPIATGRLRDKNPLVRRIDIDATDDSVRVVFDRGRTYRGQLDQWTDHRFDGDTVRVQFRHRGDALVQLFRTDSGSRRNVYRLKRDGRLQLDVTVQSGSLPRDMTYTLLYRR